MHQEVELTTPRGAVTLRQYGPAGLDTVVLMVGGVGGGWDSPAANVISARYSDHAEGRYIIDGPAIYINVRNGDGFLESGGRYHLYTPRQQPPIVDRYLRHLRPRDFAWRFGLETDPDSGDLAMVPLPRVGTE